MNQNEKEVKVMIMIALILITLIATVGINSYHSSTLKYSCEEIKAPGEM